MHDLAARCDAAEAPDRELDAEIAATLKIVPGHDPSRYIVPLEYRVDHRHGWVAVDAVHPDGTRHCCHARETPHYTASVDAAMTLVPADAFWTVLTAGAASNTFQAAVIVPDYADRPLDYSQAATPALALCAASLRARAT